MRLWTHRAMVCLLGLLRAALLVILFHASGLAHIAADVHEIVTTGHHAGTPLDHDDDDGPTQAPGSPNCHHAQPGSASLASPAFIRLDIAESSRLGVSGPSEQAPTTPPSPSIFRPPRA